MADRIHQRLGTLEQIATESGGSLSVSTLRWWIHTDRLGFRACVVRPGNRTYIDRDALGRWLEASRMPSRHARAVAVASRPAPRPRFGGRP